MNTIQVYVESMFASLPQTSDLIRLKQELLAGMEDKYMELKAAGKSEHEAIGIVISEFGNIEELTAELGIQERAQEEVFPVLTEAEVMAYTAAKRSVGFWSGLGVILCMGGVALLIALDTLFETNSSLLGADSMEKGTMLGLVGMFVCITIGVGMFIYSGMKLDSFKSMNRGFQLSYEMRRMLQHNQAHFHATYRFSMIAGVCLCVLSPVCLFIFSFVNDDLMSYGVSGFLIIISLAVFLFVYYGNIQGAYTRLLEEAEAHLVTEKKDEERVVGALSGIVWSLATAIFLFTGFIYHRWDINWAIFPITAVLLGMLNPMYSLFKRK